MMHPSTEPRWVNEVVGLGVYATKPIAKGSITYALDPLELILAPHNKLLEDVQIAQMVEKYSYVDNSGRYILSWDHAKYVNHSCSANSMSTGYGFEIALRDIDVGEQITDEYGLFNMFYNLKCACGSSNCRGTIKKDDMMTFSKIWDEQVKEVLSQIKVPEQPLWNFLSDKTKQQLENYLTTGKSYKSVNNLHLKKKVFNSYTPHAESNVLQLNLANV
ncbi:MAG: SET domain-containing protein-lysine N-methyltransferase [Oligoflexales bacterium]|nr:SET domain-containing protein-lysine N-methyltransferase [Oligoflexales bacterium]